MFYMLDDARKVLKMLLNFLMACEITESAQVDLLKCAAKEKNLSLMRIGYDDVPVRYVYCLHWGSDDDASLVLLTENAKPLVNDPGCEALSSVNVFNDIMTYPDMVSEFEELNKDSE